jgi:hypothetical protein
MLGDENIDVQELQEKLDLVEAKLEELAEESGGSDEPDLGFVQVSSSSKSFFLHWITVEDTEFEKCEDVDSVQKALQAFKEADEKRSDSQRSFLHGDMIVLMCNSAKEEDEETEEVTYPDSCYFIGTCIVTGDGDIHEEDPDPDIKLSTKFGGKHFIAWNTCGGESCPEEPDAIQIDELAIPESLGGGSEQNISGIEIVQPFGSPNKTILHKLNSLTFTKTEPEEESADEEASTDYIMFQDGEEYTSGALFKLSNKINESSDGYDVKADVNQVSLYSSTAIIQEVTYKSKAYDLQKIDITSDSCGELKREPAKDEDDNVIPPENINLLTKSDESGSQHSIGSIDVISGSDEVELGTLDLQSLAVTDQHFMNGDFFVPRIAGTAAQINGIVNNINDKEEITLLNDFTIEVVQTPVGDSCTSITITPKFKKQDFTFHSGLLTNVAAPGDWQAGVPSSFTLMNCTACDATLSCAAPSVWTSPGSTLIATPTGGDNQFPDCSRSYFGQITIDTDPNDNYYKEFTLTVTRKGGDAQVGYKDFVTYTEQWAYESCDPNAGWDSKDATISFEKVYTPDANEPHLEIWQSAKGVYIPTYSKKEKVDCNSTETEENFYSSNLTIL